MGQRDEGCRYPENVPSFSRWASGKERAKSWEHTYACIDTHGHMHTQTFTHRDKHALTLLCPVGIRGSHLPNHSGAIRDARMKPGSTAACKARTFSALVPPLHPFGGPLLPVPRGHPAYTLKVLHPGVKPRALGMWGSLD